MMAVAAKHTTYFTNTKESLCIKVERWNPEMSLGLEYCAILTLNNTSATPRTISLGLYSDKIRLITAYKPETNLGFTLVDFYFTDFVDTCTISQEDFNLMCLVKNIQPKYWTFIWDLYRLLTKQINMLDLEQVVLNNKGNLL